MQAGWEVSSSKGTQAAADLSVEGRTSPAAGGGGCTSQRGATGPHFHLHESEGL